MRYEDKIGKILRVVDNGPPDPENGTEYPVYMLAVDDDGVLSIISLLNPDTAFLDVTAQVPEYFDYSSYDEFPTGVYQARIKIEGSGPSYYGEYDSWMVIEEIKQYKLGDECLVDFEPGTVTQCPW